MLIQIVSILILTSGLQCQEYSFPNLTNFHSFHSLLRHTVIAEDGRQISTLMEEHFDVVHERGSLKYKMNGVEHSVFYYSSSMQYMHFELPNDLIKQSCSIGSIKDKDNMGILWDLVSFPTDKEPVLMGPSAIWRIENIEQKSKEITIVKDAEKKIIRGIETDLYTSLMTIEGVERTVNLYLIDQSWNKFENYNEQIPVQIKITEHNTFTDANTTHIIDYYLFEPLDVTYAEFKPTIGIGCVGLQTDVRKPDLKYYDFYTMMDTPTSRTKIWYDSTAGLARTDYYDIVRKQEITVVEDLFRSVSYTTKERQFCEMSHNLDESFLAQEHSFDSAEFMGFDSDKIYYLGQAFKRGILCNVWEYVRFNDDNEPGKVVYTFYFNSDNTVEVEADGRDVPVQLVVTVYFIDKTNNKPNRTVFETNIFEFTPVYYEKNSYEVFDVRNCYDEPEQRQFYDFFISSHDEFAIKYVNDLKQNVVETLIEKLKISQIRIPVVNVELIETGMIISVLILDNPPSIFYFEEEGQAVNLTQKEINYITKNSKRECADIASKTVLSTGYIICNSITKGEVCIISFRAKEDEEIVNHDLGNCIHYEEKFRRDQHIADLNFEQIFEKLTELVILKDLQFEIFENDESGHDSETSRRYFPVETVIEGESVSDLHDVNDEKIKLIFGETKLITTNQESMAIGSNIDSFGSCYTGCKNNKDLQCQSFSFCKQNLESACVISSKLMTVDISENEKTSYTTHDEYCSTYVISYLEQFDKKEGHISWGFQKADKLIPDVSSSAECARACLKEDNFTCRSFEYCGENSCGLMASHGMDLSKKHEKENKETSCNLYTLKYLDEYINTGFGMVDDPAAEVLRGESAENCALMCSETDEFNCLSFNYCPPSEKEKSICELSTLSVLSDVPTKSPNQHCRNYEQKFPRKIIPDPAAVTQGSALDSGKLGSTGFFGIIFGMFFVGIVVGIVAYYGFVYIREKRRHSGPGLGLSVRFLRHQDAI